MTRGRFQAVAERMRGVGSRSAGGVRRLSLAMAACCAAALLTGASFASDAPHWVSPSLNITCDSQCHTLHNSLGSNLTQAASNSQLCASCHNSAGDAKRMSIPTGGEASLPSGGGPGSGSWHAFSAPAVSSTHGAGLPLDFEMKRRIVCADGGCADDAEREASGSIVCSTCHNQHRATSAIGGTSRISEPQKVSGTDLGGDGTVSSGGSFTGSEGTWYHIRITDTGPTPPNFQWRSFVDSNIDPDTNPDGWSVWSGDTNLGADVLLADGVTVTFDAGTFVAGEEFELFASYPFLRVGTVDPGDSSGSHICLQCHGERDMDHTVVETHGYGADGVAGGGDDAFRSHPVGVGLNANGKNYDRSAPLDGDGSADDGNAFNTLALDANNDVHCLTCHGIHNAHSNTLSAGAFPAVP